MQIEVYPTCDSVKELKWQLLFDFFQFYLRF
jgi:hypothetical protein